MVAARSTFFTTCRINFFPSTSTVDHSTAMSLWCASTIDLSKAARPRQRMTPLSQFFDGCH